jgi:hypothetical protein
MGKGAALPVNLLGPNEVFSVLSHKLAAGLGAGSATGEDAAGPHPAVR